MRLRQAVLLIAVPVVLIMSAAARANGGTLQLSRAPAGPFELTVYTSPTPLRVGMADVSVAVEWAGSGDIEPNARVVVIAEPVGHAGPGGAYEATHERATDPGFYAADVVFPRAGRWRLEVLTQTVSDEGAVVVNVDVAPPSLPDSPQPSVLPSAAIASAALVAAVAGGLIWRRWAHKHGRPRSRAP